MTVRELEHIQSEQQQQQQQCCLSVRSLHLSLPLFKSWIDACYLNLLTQRQSWPRERRAQIHIGFPSVMIFFFQFSLCCDFLQGNFIFFLFDVPLNVQILSAVIVKRHKRSEMNENYIWYYSTLLNLHVKLFTVFIDMFRSYAWGYSWMLNWDFLWGEGCVGVSGVCA